MTSRDAGLPAVQKWWQSWAPYWEHLEDRHLSTLVADTLLDTISSPVLVVGSGQGLVVDHLKQKGFDITGVDREKEMIAYAKKRRGLYSILADAAALPFPDNAFGTVIIATGVVDYLSDETLIAAIIAEAGRVTRNNGDLLVAFYQLPRRVERVNRQLGVINEKGDFCLRRIFEIMRIHQRGLLAPVPTIARWTGRSRFVTGCLWLWLGMTLPAAMRREQRELVALFKSAAEKGVSSEALHQSVPESLPYRNVEQIVSLMKCSGLSRFTLDLHTDCAVVRHHKFGKLDVARESARPPIPGGDWIIRTDNLKKKYRPSERPAVEGLSITVERGCVFGILGPNGAGKTTTLSMLAGLVSPTSGKIEIAGDTRKDFIHGLGYVPQELALYERLTARDNLIFFGHLYGVKDRRLAERIEALLALTGLSHRADEMIIRFSQGMMRRLNLAVGLVHEPTVVLMDEPTVGIDPQSRNRIFDAIEKLKQDGTTILYTTHCMEEATRLCDRIAIMDQGKVILNETPKEAVSKYGSFRFEFEHSGANVGTFIRALKSAPYAESADLENGKLVLTTDAGQKRTDTVFEVKRLADRYAVDLSLKSLVEPNLESLFLDITGRRLRDTGGV